MNSFYIRYDLLQIIGEGGQGKVWKAFNENSGEIVALKSIPLGNANVMKQAEKEINILANVSEKCTEYIVCYYGYGKDRKNLYIEMEYIHGPNLLQWAEDLYYDWDILDTKVIPIMKHIAEAISFIHNYDIIHKDIKPENIIVNMDTPKLIDFGLACFTDKICYKDDKKCCTDRSGTFVYMPPEFFTEGVAIYASDIWSLGATIFRVITGEYCFNINNPNDYNEVRQAIIYENPKDFISKRDILKRAIYSCLEKNVYLRITSENLINMLK